MANEGNCFINVRNEHEWAVPLPDGDGLNNDYQSDDWKNQFGKRCASLLLSQNTWVTWRRELVDFRDDGSTHHTVDVEFALPEGARVYLAENQRGAGKGICPANPVAFAAPIAFLGKGTLTKFELTREDGTRLAHATESECIAFCRAAASYVTHLALEPHKTSPGTIKPTASPAANEGVAHKKGRGQNQGPTPESCLGNTIGAIIYSRYSFDGRPNSDREDDEASSGEARRRSQARKQYLSGLVDYLRGCTSQLSAIESVDKTHSMFDEEGHRALGMLEEAVSRARTTTQSARTSERLRRIQACLSLLCTLSDCYPLIALLPTDIKPGSRNLVRIEYDTPNWEINESDTSLESVQANAHKPAAPNPIGFFRSLFVEETSMLFQTYSAAETHLELSTAPGTTIATLALTKGGNTPQNPCVNPSIESAGTRRSEGSRLYVTRAADNVAVGIKGRKKSPCVQLDVTLVPEAAAYPYSSTAWGAFIAVLAFLSASGILDIMYEDAGNLAQNSTAILGLVLTLYFARSVGGLGKHPAAQRLGRANGIVTASMATLAIGMFLRIVAVAKTELGTNIAPEMIVSVCIPLAWAAFLVTGICSISLAIGCRSYTKLKRRTNDSAPNKAYLLAGGSAEIYLPRDEEGSTSECPRRLPQIPFSELIGKSYVRESLDDLRTFVKGLNSRC